jgi:outer membrane protein assembly factor BamD
MSRTALRAFLTATLLGLSACGGTVPSLGSLFSSGDETPIESRTAEAIFADARQNQKERNFKAASFMYDEVERLYPYSDVAKDAMLLSAVSSYEAGEYDKAVLSAERFIGFYPSDAQTDYARYIVAQSYYEQIVDVGRDQGMTVQARQALDELIARHPDSKYVKDAELKRDTTIDQLAGKEMTVGRYYLKNGQYIGAINRFQTVAKEYDTTSHVEEALHRLVEANLALGLVGEAKSAAAVLGFNYPGSPWYEASYALLTGENLTGGLSQDAWYKRMYRQVILGNWL